MQATDLAKRTPTPSEYHADAARNPGRSSGWFSSYDYPFLIAALASFVASVSLWFLVDHDYGVFVGLWVPSILALWNGVKLTVGKE